MDSEMPDSIFESGSSAIAAVSSGYDAAGAESDEYLLNDIGVALRLASERGFN